MPFAKGPDPNRHQFTAEECRRGGRKGFRVTLEKHGHLGLWLFLRLKATCPKERTKHAKDNLKARARA